MKNSLLFVGLDVHAQNIPIALALGGEAEARLYGTITHDLHALEKVFAKLRKAHPEAELRVCYEAGPTGFVLARRLAQLQIACTVVAPSLIPRKPGERIKIAQALHRSQSALGDFFRRMKARLGAPEAITATAEAAAYGTSGGRTWASPISSPASSIISSNIAAPTTHLSSPTKKNSTAEDVKKTSANKPPFAASNSLLSSVTPSVLSAKSLE